MPRPLNKLLRELFDADVDGVLCKLGSCGGKRLNNHAGNLERHLKSFHLQIYQTYLEKKNNVNRSDSDIVKIIQTVSKKKIESAIVALFTKSGRPLKMAEDTAFKTIAEPVFNALSITVNQHNVVDKILLQSNQIKKKLIEEMRGRLLSLKVDAATRHNLSVIGVNVQYMKNNNIIIHTLAIKELKNRHTSEYLKSVIMEILNDYQIDITQILTITTDNGANMIKAVDDLNADIEDMCEENIAATENSLREIEESMSSQIITNVRCGVHTLQLCVNDVLKTETVKEKIDKFKFVVKKLRTQTYTSLLKNGGYKRVILGCVTRWNSTYDMLDRLQELKEIITSLSEHNPDLIIKEEEWSFLVQFLKTFKSVYNATLKLQSEKLIYSDLYIILMEITLQLERLETNDLQVSLLRAINKRKPKLFENELFSAAVFLDPRIKVVLEPEQILKAKSMICKVYSRISSLREIDESGSEEQISTVIDEPSTSSQSRNAPKTMNEFLCSLYPIPNSEDPINSTVSVMDAELIMYEHQHRIPFETDVMDFWSTRNNALTCIAETILAVPCTQVSVERLFSALKYIMSDQRSNLTPMALEHILFVRANGTFDL